MEKGAITLLDVLGWKGIWQRKSDSVGALTKLIDNAEKKANIVIKIMSFMVSGYDIMIVMGILSLRGHMKETSGMV